MLKTYPRYEVNFNRSLGTLNSTDKSVSTGGIGSDGEALPKQETYLFECFLPHKRLLLQGATVG
eukprot:1731249-Pyramimonas_sp.AAC.4